MLTSETRAEYGHNTPPPIFDWMKEHPLLHQQFGNFIAGYTQGRPSWLDFFPAEDQPAKGLNEADDVVLLVDVSGRMGQDLEEFPRPLPKVKGELVLQVRKSLSKEQRQVLLRKALKPWRMISSRRSLLKVMTI